MRYLNSGESFHAHCDLCSSPYASHDIDSGLYCRACAEEILAERAADSDGGFALQAPIPPRLAIVLFCGLSFAASLIVLGFTLTSVWGLIYGTGATP